MRVLLLLSAAAALASAASACNMGDPAASTSSPTPPITPGPVAHIAPAAAAPAAPSAAAPVGAAPLKLGAPIASTSLVALTDVAKAPADYKGKTIATSGTVVAVCQERGCWMEIKDATADVNVRMHGHSFFVPKTSSGRKARVEGQVVLMKDGHECEDMAATGATVELDATGVELM